jgi:WhiB family redox-sensing transcriptional regulator
MINCGVTRLLASLSTCCWSHRRLWVMPFPTLGRWVAQAACRGADKNLFFPERGDADAVRAAKAICASCPVLESCRRHALATPRERGIWGGLTDSERDKARQRARNGTAA